MPNTPASDRARHHGHGGQPQRRSAGQRALATALLSAVGEVVPLEDEACSMPSTAVSGSGPAYVFYLTECLAEAGRRGLDDELAMKLARATVAGPGS